MFLQVATLLRVGALHMTIKWGIRMFNHEPEEDPLCHMKGLVPICFSEKLKRGYFLQQMNNLNF